MAELFKKRYYSLPIEWPALKPYEPDLMVIHQRLSLVLLREQLLHELAVVEKELQECERQRKDRLHGSE